ncbi:MAG: AraC family transcriptional regulator [Clostridia bacterium]|nr:AraC family transcriptional regulator [Clostridia bacterium]
MRSIQVAAYEEKHLISWQRTEDTLVGSLRELYFNMTFTGCYVCRKSFQINRQRFASAQLLLTLEGEGRLHYQDRDYRLTPGTVMLINTWNLHEYHALDDGWKFKYLHFCGGMSDDYLTYINAHLGHVFSLHNRVLYETEEHMDAIFRETDGTGLPDYPTVSSNIYSILTSFLSQKNSVGPAQKSAAAIHRAAAYIAENYARNITTQEIADAVYLSRSYMSEMFAKTYGMAPHEYLIMYRLSHVKDDLINTQRSLSDIAESSGFQNVFALSRVFKQKFGISPSEYRRSMGNGD